MPGSPPRRIEVVVERAAAVHLREPGGDAVGVMLVGRAALLRIVSGQIDTVLAQQITT